MNDNPETWSLPPRWAPLQDGEWEFEQLRRFAMAVLVRDPAYRMHLDAFEDGYLKVDVHLPASKVGEVFVNRADDEPERAVFRLFVGHDGHEQDVRSIDEAVECVLAAKGAWRDHPGGEP